MMLVTLLSFLPLLGMVAAAGEPTQGGAKPGPGAERHPFGQTKDGQAVEMFILTNRNGMVAKVITYGATLTELDVPDSGGKPGNIVLGFDTLAGYLGEEPYFGATIGRVANRIAKGTFTLNGVTYHVPVNNGPNSLHGGTRGFDKVVWQAEAVAGSADPAVKFTHRSPDGDQGYPGNLVATVTYTLTGENGLRLDYTATTDKATPVNLTNHSYFNLAGDGADSILDHVLLIEADDFTPVNDTLIPTGEIKPVKGTPMDFTTPMAIGARIAQVPGPKPGGYDHNYVLRGGGKSLALAARVREPKTGRVREVLTTEPGLQFYSGNFLDGTIKNRNGVPYKQHDAFCLETQHFPDSVNHPNFPSTILQPGQTYRSQTIYRFPGPK